MEMKKLRITGVFSYWLGNGSDREELGSLGKIKKSEAQARTVLSCMCHTAKEARNLQQRSF